MRLSQASLARTEASRFGYDRNAQQVGIVHFGIGAFHRAHQAWYTDRAMDAGDRNWTIIGVSLRSPDVAAQLNSQDGLYTLVERAAGGDDLRVIGAVRNVLVASREPEAVIAALAAPATRIASFTVTEKGYCRTPDLALDLAQAGPGSFYRFVAEGLRRRHDAGLPGLTLLSCDNLADNGRQLGRLMCEYIAHHDPALSEWFDAECACPSTMVDRIVPATTDADLANTAAALGLVDAGTVMTEPFSQWVIEDRFAGARPTWEQVGAELVRDVAPYETAKLRMLNGAHSALAYIGLRRGHTFVHEAVADPAIRPLAEALMRDEAAPTVDAARGQDLMRYADDLLDRFANPALNHRLIQIAMDGSQKIPQRWLETLAIQAERGRQCPGICTALAAWLRHVRGDNVARWGAVEDPLADRLAATWRQHSADTILPALFGAGGLVSASWTPSQADHNAIMAALR